MTLTTFDHLLAAHAPRVLRAALGLLGEEQEAREVAQEALLKAYKARDRYDGSRPFYPWLYRIVRNTCLDALRHRRHLPVAGLESDRVEDRAPTVLDRVALGESIGHLRVAMQTLSDEHREVLSMRHFQELSYVEIGELLDLPQGTVMSRLYRARKALVRALEEGP